jgi:dephospho-CoA kinase
MLIGLTGQIGAGKTTVAKILKDMGAVIIDADRIGRDVLAHNPAVKRALVRTFGSQVIDKRGRINRRTVAAAAFANESCRGKLNQIVHPRLLRELHRQVKRRAKGGKTVVIDAALLLEWKIDRTVDAVIAVRAPAVMRLNRMVARGFERADIRRRMHLQLRWPEYRRRADVVITNNGNRAGLRRQVVASWNCLHR